MHRTVVLLVSLILIFLFVRKIFYQTPGNILTLKRIKFVVIKKNIYEITGRVMHSSNVCVSIWNYILTHPIVILSNNAQTHIGVVSSSINLKAHCPKTHWIKTTYEKSLCYYKSANPELISLYFYLSQVEQK